MNIKNCIFVISISLFCTNSFAGWMKSNKFVDMAKQWKLNFDDNTRGNHVDIRGYQSYVFGVLDVSDGVLFCLPNNANGSQVFSIVYNYIDQHPEKWSDSAFSLVYKPLSDNFPCKKAN